MALSAALAFFLAWMAAVSLLVHRDRTTAIAALAWLHRHDLFLAALCAIAAAALAARRRALSRAATSRSWTAALPVERSTERWQSMIADSVPAVVLACVLAALFGSLCLAGLFNGIPAPTLAWAATTGGVALGAGIGRWLPQAREDVVYEGSRYVPHRRRARTSIPTGSLSALGSWPVRQMFASARPKTIARVLLPLLLAAPMGSAAAEVMVAIAVQLVIGAIVLLVAAAVSACARGARWLEPLPVSPGLLARSTLIPAVALLFCLTALETWLLWVLGSSPARCLEIGMLVLTSGSLVAVAGGLLAMHPTRRRPAP